jgi:hypothetical protein
MRLIVALAIAAVAACGASSPPPADMAIAGDLWSPKGAPVCTTPNLDGAAVCCIGSGHGGYDCGWLKNVAPGPICTDPRFPDSYLIPNTDTCAPCGTCDYPK